MQQVRDKFTYRENKAAFSLTEQLFQEDSHESKNVKFSSEQ